MKRGLLLLSGGTSLRMGAPKHALDHPDGGSWGGHLVRVFEAVFPGAPIQVLGDALPDRPRLPRHDDPREGPAVALRLWAGLDAPPVDVWWVVACDQVRWTPGRLSAWAGRCEAEDPAATHWVLARHDGQLQPLGGWLPQRLLPALRATSAHSLLALVESMPHRVLPGDGREWLDVDTPGERAEFEGEN